MLTTAVSQSYLFLHSTEQLHIYSLHVEKLSNNKFIKESNPIYINQHYYMINILYYAMKTLYCMFVYSFR